MSVSATVGDLIDIAKGRKPASILREPAPGRSRLIQIGDLRADAELVFTTENGGVTVQPTDICIAWDGANAGTVGYNLDGVIGSTIARLRPRDRRKIITPYLGRFLQSKFAVLNGGSYGATIPHVSRDRLLGLQLPLPEPDEQRRIAAILEKADGIRARRCASVSLTDEFLSAAFLERFGDPVTNPKGWDTEPLNKFGRVSTGNTPSRAVPENFSGALEWAKSDNLNTPFHYVTRATETLSELGASSARTVEAGAVLVTCIAGSRECIGNLAIADRLLSFNQQINAIQPFASKDTAFLYSQLLVGKKLVQSASTDSMKGMVSKSAFERIRLIAPPADARADFAEMFDRILNLAARSRQTAADADALYASLADRAFNGEL